MYAFICLGVRYFFSYVFVLSLYMSLFLSLFRSLCVYFVSS